MRARPAQSAASAGAAMAKTAAIADPPSKILNPRAMALFLPLVPLFAVIARN
jgi:hypothetical protein